MIPSDDRLLNALAATWPSAETAQIGDWRIRRGLGGGSRVSSVWPVGEPGRPLPDAVDEAERIMRGWGQRPLFQLTKAGSALEAELSRRGYAPRTPTVLMAAAIPGLAGRDLGAVRPVEADAPLAAMEGVWALDDIGPERLAVMDRARGPKTFLALRLGDRIAGVAFVAVDDDIAMLHALVAAPAVRRAGVGRAGVVAAARFGLRHGATTLALAVTEANGPARALYSAMGLLDAGGYCYQQAPER